MEVVQNLVRTRDHLGSRSWPPKTVLFQDLPFPLFIKLKFSCYNETFSLSMPILRYRWGQHPFHRCFGSWENCSIVAGQHFWVRRELCGNLHGSPFTETESGACWGAQRGPMPRGAECALEHLSDWTGLHSRRHACKSSWILKYNHIQPGRFVPIIANILKITCPQSRNLSSF